MQDDLVERHRQEFDLVVSTADAKTLTEEQLLGWAGAINSIRLILGTYLDVSEDDQSPGAGDDRGSRVPLADLRAGGSDRGAFRPDLSHGDQPMPSTTCGPTTGP